MASHGVYQPERYLLLRMDAPGEKGGPRERLPGQPPHQRPLGDGWSGKPVFGGFLAQLMITISVFGHLWQIPLD